MLAWLKRAFSSSSPTPDRIDQWREKKAWEPILNALACADEEIRRKAVQALGEMAKYDAKWEQLASLQCTNRLPKKPNHRYPSDRPRSMPTPLGLPHET